MFGVIDDGLYQIRFVVDFILQMGFCRRFTLLAKTSKPPICLVLVMLFISLVELFVEGTHASVRVFMSLGERPFDLIHKMLVLVLRYLRHSSSSI